MENRFSIFWFASTPAFVALLLFFYFSFPTPCGGCVLFCFCRKVGERMRRGRRREGEGTPKDGVSNLSIFEHFCHPIFAHNSIKKAAEASSWAGMRKMVCLAHHNDVLNPFSSPVFSSFRPHLLLLFYFFCGCVLFSTFLVYWGFQSVTKLLLKLSKL